MYIKSDMKFFFEQHEDGLMYAIGEDDILKSQINAKLVTF